MMGTYGAVGTDCAGDLDGDIYPLPSGDDAVDLADLAALLGVYGTTGP